MNNETINVDRLFLQKVAQFTSLMVAEVNNLKAQLNVQLTKKAQVDESYSNAVNKAAVALYNADLDFLTGDVDHQKFKKRASEDPTYLARTLEKVCNAADVTLIGRPARVAAMKKQAFHDPVYVRAFGFESEPNEQIGDWE